MNLIRSFVDSPVKVAVGALMLSLFGVVALLRMPMQLTPEVQTPTLTVETRWPGASPQEIEQEIVHEQEAELKSVEGITKMTSESSDSVQQDHARILVGTNMDEALLKVNSRLNQVREYPEDADQPIISTANANDRPIAWFILSARRPDDARWPSFSGAMPTTTNWSPACRRPATRRTTGWRCSACGSWPTNAKRRRRFCPPSRSTSRNSAASPRTKSGDFERVSGVSQAERDRRSRGRVACRRRSGTPPPPAGLPSTTYGGCDGTRTRYVQPATIPRQAALRRANARSVPVRPSRSNRSCCTSKTVRRSIFATSPKCGMAIKSPTVWSGVSANRASRSWLRETGANVLDVMDGLQERSAELNDGLLKARGLQLTQVYDETDYIESAVTLVSKTSSSAAL